MFLSANAAKFLYDAGRQHARRAIDDYTREEDHGMAAVSAGCAVELLLKSSIAKISPLLLAGETRAKTLLALERQSLFEALLGEAGQTQRPLHKIKSVSREDLLIHLKQELGWSAPAGLDDALKVRDAAVHLGIWDDTSLRAAILFLIRLVPILPQPIQEYDADRFWGDQRSVSDELSRKAYDAEHAQLVAIVAAARQRYATLIRGLGLDQKDQVIAALADRAPEHEHVTRQPCIACGNPGYVVYRRATEVWDEDEDGHFVLTSLAPSSLQCSVCGLKVRWQLLALMVAAPVPVEHRRRVTEEEYIAMMGSDEPDPDSYDPTFDR